MHTTVLIREKDQAEQAVRESEQRYKRLLASVTDYVYSVTVEHGRPAATAHGPGCEAVMGYTSKDFEADPYLWYRMIYSEDRPAVRAQAERILHGGTSAPLEHRIIHKDGRLRWIRNTPVPHHDAQGRLMGYDGLVSDITERKALEEQHRLDQARLQAILDNSPAVIHLKDVQGRYILINRRFEHLFHVAREAVAGKSPHDLFPQETANILRNHDQKVLDTLTPLEFEEALPQEDGAHIYLSVKFPLLDAAGVPHALCGIATDITERKRAENAILQNSRIQTITNSLLRLSLSDVPLEEILKETLDLLFDLPWFKLESKGAVFLVEPNSPDLVMKAHRGLEAPIQRACRQVPSGRCHCGQALLRGQVQFASDLDERHETRYEGMTPHGHYCVPIKAVGRILGVFTLYLAPGHPHVAEEEQFLVATADVLAGIIERKRAEEQLLKAHAELTQKEAHLRKTLQELQVSHEALKETELQLIQAARLESVGTLTAGVAHEVKNPLQTILMGLDFLDHNLAAGKDNNTALVLTDMRDAVTRANAIIRELLQLSAARDFEPKEEDLNSLVEHSLRLINNEVIASKINVVRNLGANLPCVRLDHGKMEQVFINLFMNALHAMSQGGVLTVTTRHRRFGEDLKLTGPAFSKFEPGDSVVIAEVQDTGTGIPEANLPKIFDPFFTTKPTGVGTGLGLSVVRKIMDLHGAAIDVRNAPLGGVLVTLILKAEPDEKP